MVWEAPRVTGEGKHKWPVLFSGMIEMVQGCGLLWIKQRFGEGLAEKDNSGA
jgi:hypothetical protein